MEFIKIFRYEWRCQMKKLILFLTILIGLSGCQSVNKDEVLEDENQVIKVERQEITSQLTNTDLYQVNTYLSDLSSVRFEKYEKETLDHDKMLNLGYWLHVFDGMQGVVEEVDGAYYDVFDYEEFNKKINLYFDCQLEKKGNSEWLFQENKFYHPSIAMGYSINTVTQLDRIFDNGDGSFLIEGSIYEFEPSMEEDLSIQYLQPKSTWTSSMESKLVGTITAKMSYSDRLNQYVIDNYQANYFDHNEVLNDSESQTVEEIPNNQQQEQNPEPVTDFEWDPAWSTKADGYYEESSNYEQQNDNKQQVVESEGISEDEAKSLLSAKVSSWGVIQMSNGKEEYEGKLCWSFDVSEKERPSISQFFVDQKTGKVYDSFGNEL